MQTSAERTFSQRDQRSALTAIFENIKTADNELLRSPISVVTEGVSPTRFALDAVPCASPSTSACKGRQQARVLRWAPSNECIEVTRFDYTAIVGDIRDAANPNYCAIGCARDLRLSSFANEAAERACEAWFSALKQQARRSRRRRSEAQALA